MPTALTTKVLLTANVIMGILEMDSFVLVSRICHLSNFYLTFLYFCYYNLNFIFLLDINECLTNPCHVNASCTDNEGSFDCQCRNGFAGNGITCLGKRVSLIDSSQCCLDRGKQSNSLNFRLII